MKTRKVGSLGLGVVLNLSLLLVPATSQAGSIFNWQAESDPNANNQGLSGSDSFGEVIAIADDYTGDGINDVVVGAPWDHDVDSGGTFRGRLYLVNGATGSRLFDIKGTEDNELLGQSVAALDLNNDGTLDIAYSAPGKNGDAGEVKIIDGAGLQEIPAEINELMVLDGDAAGNTGFGNALAVHGDQLFVGAFNSDDASTNGGTVYAYDLADENSCPASPCYTWKASQADGGNFGWSVAVVETMDSGSTAQLAVGEPLDGTGEVHLLDISNGSTLASYSLSQLGFSEAAQFGYSVASGGDQNDDGLMELVVGAPKQDSGAIQEAGAAYVFTYNSGAGTLDLLLNELSIPVFYGGQANNDQLGHSVAAVGDTGPNPSEFFGVAMGLPGINLNAGQVEVRLPDGSLFDTFYGQEQGSEAGHYITSGIVNPATAPAMMFGSTSTIADGEGDFNLGYVNSYSLNFPAAGAGTSNLGGGCDPYGISSANVPTLSLANPPEVGEQLIITGTDYVPNTQVVLLFSRISQNPIPYDGDPNDQVDPGCLLYPDILDPLRQIYVADTDEFGSFSHYLFDIPGGQAGQTWSIQAINIFGLSRLWPFSDAVQIDFGS